MTAAPDDAAVIRSMVAAQFASLRWSEDIEPDWQAFEESFLDDARLFPAARPVTPTTVAGFQERMVRLHADGTLARFEERLVGFACTVAGSVAVATAGCEMTENGTRTTHDVSAFLLVKDADGWRIAAQAWDAVAFTAARFTPSGGV